MSQPSCRADWFEARCETLTIGKRIALHNAGEIDALATELICSGLRSACGRMRVDDDHIHNLVHFGTHCLALTHAGIPNVVGVLLQGFVVLHISMILQHQIGRW